MVRTQNKNPIYALSSFDVSTSNEKSYLAIKDCLKELCVHNPLFLFGESGCGKTYLIRAFTNEIIKQGKKALYITENEVTDDMVQLLLENKKDQLKKLYNEYDVLVIDDLFSINWMTDTQKAFTELIDEFYSENKQVILVSTRSLDDFPVISEYIKSLKTNLIINI